MGDSKLSGRSRSEKSPGMDDLEFTGLHDNFFKAIANVLVFPHERLEFARKKKYNKKKQRPDVSSNTLTFISSLNLREDHCLSINLSSEKVLIGNFLR
jgi:hypothetical protein